MADKRRLKYIGRGGFIAGVPARDLRPEEVMKFGIDRLLKSGLYKDLKPPKRITKRKGEVKIDPVETEIEQPENNQEG